MDAHRAQTEYIKSVAGTASTGAADQIASACSGAAAMLAGGFWFIGKRDLRRWIGLAVVVIAVVLVVDTFPRADVIVLAVITLALPAVAGAAARHALRHTPEPWMPAGKTTGPQAVHRDEPPGPAVEGR
jgi:drug/metabolite transporter (DMT)-like permease